MLCLNIAGRVANSVDHDETPRSAASHMGLHCLLRPVCPNTYGKYDMSETNLILHEKIRLKLRMKQSMNGNQR